MTVHRMPVAAGRDISCGRVGQARRYRVGRNHCRKKNDSGLPRGNRRGVQGAGCHVGHAPVIVMAGWACDVPALMTVPLEVEVPVPTVIVTARSRVSELF